MRPDLPLVTVITPVYNQAAYLAETLRSIRTQAYPNIQHVVVNDGSTDNTDAVITALRAEPVETGNYHLKIIRHENVGEAAAINAGFRTAEGDYVVVVNADDPQPADWLAACVDAMQTNPEAAVGYPDWAIIDADGNVTHNVDLPPYSRTDLIAGARCLPGPGTLIRRSMVDGRELRQNELLYTSDYACWLNLSLKGPFMHISGTRAYWREHRLGKSARTFATLRAREYLRVMREFFDRPDLPGDVRAMKGAALAHAAYQGARMTWRSNFPAAMVFFLKALVRGAL